MYLVVCLYMYVCNIYVIIYSNDIYRIGNEYERNEWRNGEYRSGYKRNDVNDV